MDDSDFKDFDKIVQEYSTAEKDTINSDNSNQLCFDCFSLSCCCHEISALPSVAESSVVAVEQDSNPVFQQEKSIATSEESLYFCTDCCHRFNDNDINLHTNGKCLKQSQQQQQQPHKNYRSNKKIKTTQLIDVKANGISQTVETTNIDVSRKIDIEVNKTVKTYNANRRNQICTQCFMQFASLLNYEAHWNYFHQNVHKSLMFTTKPIGCYFCKRLFPASVAYKKHLSHLHRKDLANLGICGFINRTHFCHVCGFVDKSAENILYHLLNIHQISPKNPNSIIESRKKIRGNGQGIKCAACSLVLQCHQKYKRHWARHHSYVDCIKMYKNCVECKLCTVEDRYFANQSNYQMHLVQCHKNEVNMKVHFHNADIGKRSTVRCSLCAFSCDSRKALNYHVEKDHHEHMPATKIINGDNGNEINNIEQLDHVKSKCYYRTQRGDYLIKCLQCSKVVHKRLQYETHWNRYHKGVDKSKMYKQAISCRFCNVRFPVFIPYLSHLKRVHLKEMKDRNLSLSAVASVICRTCFFVATDVVSLEKHLNEAHRGFSAEDSLNDRLTADTSGTDVVEECGNSDDIQLGLNSSYALVDSCKEPVLTCTTTGSTVIQVDRRNIHQSLDSVKAEPDAEEMECGENSHDIQHSFNSSNIRVDSYIEQSSSYVTTVNPVIQIEQLQDSLKTEPESLMADTYDTSEMEHENSNVKLHSLHSSSVAIDSCKEESTTPIIKIEQSSDLVQIEFLGTIRTKPYLFDGKYFFNSAE